MITDGVGAWGAKALSRRRQHRQNSAQARSRRIHHSLQNSLLVANLFFLRTLLERSRTGTKQGSDETPPKFGRIRRVQRQFNLWSKCDGNAAKIRPKPLGLTFVSHYGLSPNLFFAQTLHGAAATHAHQASTLFHVCRVAVCQAITVLFLVISSVPPR